MKRVRRQVSCDAFGSATRLRARGLKSSERGSAVLLALMIVASSSLFLVAIRQSASAAVVAAERSEEITTANMNYYHRKRWFSDHSFCQRTNFMAELQGSRFRGRSGKVVWTGKNVDIIGNAAKVNLYTAKVKEGKRERYELVQKNGARRLNSLQNYRIEVELQRVVYGKEKPRRSVVQQFLLEASRSGELVSCYAKESSRNMCLSLGKNYDEALYPACR